MNKIGGEIRGQGSPFRHVATESPQLVGAFWRTDWPSCSSPASASASASAPSSLSRASHCLYTTLMSGLEKWILVNQNLQTELKLLFSRLKRRCMISKTSAAPRGSKSLSLFISSSGISSVEELTEVKLRIELWR